MNIAIFSSTIDVTNGYGNITYEYCQSLYEQGVRFTLFLPQSEQHHGFFRWPTRYILPKYVFRFRPHTLWQYLQRLDVSEFDVVHSLLDFPYCFMAARAAKKYRKPFFMGCQGTYGVLPLTYWPEKYFLRYAYNQAIRIIVPSQFTKNKIEETGQKHYLFETIHNGVNTKRFEKTLKVKPIRPQFPGKKILLTVGALKARKGQDLVIRALPEILKTEPNLLYIIVGDGNILFTLEQVARDCEVKDHVLFVGTKTNDELVSYFQAADIFVLTPRIVNGASFEGFGIVYLEASLCRKPIIAADAGGVRDAVIDGKTGLIVPPEDPHAIAQAAIQLLRDPDRCQRLGQCGYEYAKAHDWDTITKKFIHLYTQYA